MKNIIGTKVGMMQVFDVNGKQLAATVVSCEPNQVLEIKKNGNIKVGYLDVEKAQRKSKAYIGIFKKNGYTPKEFIKEFKNTENYKVGDFITVDAFEKGQYVDVQGTTKGHGFTGAIKRWNFKVGPLAHGAGYPHRYQGSVAFGRGGSQAQRVPKGKKMSGHYGHETVTIQNLIVLEVMKARNLILLLGAIPGPAGSVVTIKTSVKFPTKKTEYKIITKEIKEEILKENENLEDKEALHKANEQAEAAAAEAAKKEAAAKQAEAAARAKEKEAAEKAAASEAKTANK